MRRRAVYEIEFRGYPSTSKPSKPAKLMKKPADNKLPLPTRYRDNPTTGEVLYEYIRASEKLRAAATLHIFDAWLQTTVKLTLRAAESLQAEVVNGRRGVAMSEALAKAWGEAAKAEEMAANFRREMRQLRGLNMPLPFLTGSPCMATKGWALADMLASLPDEGRRFDELSAIVQAAWNLYLQPGYNDFASKRAARKLKKKGRPSRDKVLSPRDSLSDLRHWHLLKVAEREGLHNLSHVFRLKPGRLDWTHEGNGTRKGSDGLPYVVGSNDKDYLNAATIRKRAGRAQGRLERLEARCPELSAREFKYAALIRANFAKLADWDKRPENAAKMQAFMESRNITGKDFEAFRKKMEERGRDMAAMVRL
jgi:hypothetical protein